MRHAVLIVSLLLNSILVAGAGYYLTQVEPRTIAEHAGLVAPRRPAYDFYADERFPNLPGAATVAIGDSYAERGPWAEVLGEPVAVRGQGGALIAEVTQWADTVPSDAERVIIWAGTNDALHGYGSAEAEEDMKALITAVNAAAPGAEVVVLGIPPLEWADPSPVNVGLAAAAEQTGATWVPTDMLDGYLADDGVHVTGAGYAQVASTLQTS